MSGLLAVVNSTATARTNPTWLGRPFVKIIKQGDPIPGTMDGVFNELTAFKLRDGVLHIVAGQGSSQKGLFRSAGFIGTDGTTASRANGIYLADANGALTKLIDGADTYPGVPVRT